MWCQGVVGGVYGVFCVRSGSGLAEKWMSVSLWREARRVPLALPGGVEDETAVLSSAQLESLQEAVAAAVAEASAAGAYTRPHLSST
jgi:hypothetical protein